MKYFIISLLIITSCTSNDSLKLAPEDRVEKDFKWNFNQERRLIYNYTAKGTSIHYNAMSGSDMNMQEELNAKLWVETNRDGTADFLTKENEILFFNEDGTVRDTMKTDISNREKGRKPEKQTGVVQLKTIYDIIFPLPQEMISVGSKTEYEVKRAFSAHGNSGFVLGSYKLMFDRYEMFLGIKCAVLEGDLDMSKISFQQNSKGEFHNSLSASGTFYFDLEKGNYVAADVEIKDDMHFIPEDDDTFSPESKSDRTSVIEVRLDTIQKIN